MRFTIAHLQCFATDRRRQNSVEVEGDDNFVKRGRNRRRRYGTLVIRNKRRGSFHFSLGSGTPPP